MAEFKAKPFNQKLAERKFRKWKAFKRNKDIFDISEIDICEGIEQKRRRTPYRTLSTEMSEKFSQSFMNSTAAISFKVESQIIRHRDKVSNSLLVNSRAPTQSISQSLDYATLGRKNQIRGVSMDKMLTRSYRESVGEQQQFGSQDRFNNFRLMQINEAKIRSFDKYLSREQIEKLHLQHVPDSNPQIPIIYEKFNYNSSTFKVSWDYSRQKEERGPIFFKLQKENSSLLNELKSENIEMGRQKCKASWNKTMRNFAIGLEKQVPSQFERTYYPPNMNFRVPKPKQVSDTKSIKIRNQAKFPEFERWELCDIKYFRLRANRRISRVKTQ